MKTLKYTVLVATLCLGLSCVARATLTPLGSFHNDHTGVNGPKSQSEEDVLAFFQFKTGETDASDCLRTGDNGVPVTGTFDLAGGGTVTITSPSTGVADISFNL